MPRTHSPFTFSIQYPILKVNPTRPRYAFIEGGRAILFWPWSGKETDSALVADRYNFLGPCHPTHPLFLSRATNFIGSGTMAANQWGWFFDTRQLDLRRVQRDRRMYRFISLYTMVAFWRTHGTCISHAMRVHMVYHIQGRTKYN
jgi:hypothetical protein